MHISPGKTASTKTIDAFNTKRLRITPWTLDDAQAFFELTQDDGFNAFPITVYRQTGIGSAQKWINDARAIREKSGLGKMSVREQQTGSLIGMVGLTPWEWEGEHLIDLTYRIRQSAWGLGYGSESAFALTEYAFETLQLKEITATITPNNVPSIKIANRLGMKFDKRITLKNVETDLFRLPSNLF